MKHHLSIQKFFREHDLPNYRIAGYFCGWKFSWKARRGPQNYISWFKNFVARDRIADDACELWTWRRGANFGFNEKRWASLAWEASIASQTQPTPAWITVRIQKQSSLGLVRSGLLKAIRPEVSWVWHARLCERQPRLQRHLEGLYWKTATMPTQQWRENDNCADPFACDGCQDATLGSSALMRGTDPVFCWSCFCSTLLCSLPQPSHAGELEKEDPVYQGHCQCGASSEKEP